MKHISILTIIILTTFIILPNCNTIFPNFQILSIANKNASSITNNSSENLNTKSSINNKSKTCNLEYIYKPILESNKNYSEMTDSEKETANKLIDNWNKLSMDFKAKYIKSKKKLKENINSYNLSKSSELAVKKLESFKDSFNTNITYANITETPNKYLGKKVTFTGTLIQATGGAPDNSLKIAVDSNTNEPLLISYDPLVMELNLHENSIIKIRGIFTETVSDLSIINGETKIPKIYASYIDVVSS